MLLLVPLGVIVTLLPVAVVGVAPEINHEYPGLVTFVTAACSVLEAGVTRPPAFL